jgi:3-carboxy-cis,cis-muconate cycloisomerase
MPQKQNPVLSLLVRSAALQAPGHAAQLHLAAANFNDERPDGAWHSEWPALRQLLRLGLGAAVQLRELAAGLQVFPQAMRRNQDLTGPLLLSEAVTAAVAPLLAGAVAGRNDADARQRLQEVVDETLRVPAADQAATYRKLLRAAVPAELLPDTRLEELLDPANYLGQAAEITRRILAAYPEYGIPPAGSHTASPTPELNGASRG